MNFFTPHLVVSLSQLRNSVEHGMSAGQMNTSRQAPKRMLVVMTSALLLFACSKDSNDFPASDSVDVDLDIALAGIVATKYNHI